MANELKALFGHPIADTEARKRITALSEEITKHCATVAEMLALDNLVAGQRVRTNGYYAEGDGGHGEYLIVSEATVNPYDTLKTANGKYAVLQHNGHVNAKQCGLKNESYGGDAWFAFYNGTALSMDINVTPLYISNTVQLNNKTEIFSSNQSILYYVGEYDAAVLSCFPGNGLTAEEWQSTRSPKLHSLTINARNAKVGVCLVNVANTNRTIYDLHVYKGYVGYLLGESWRNIFGKLNGAEQTYATFVQEQSNSGELGDFAAISDSNSINTCVFEQLISTLSPNGVLFDGYGSDNVFQMIDVSLDLSDVTQQHIACRFKIHSGTVNVIYCEHADYYVEGITYTDVYVDNYITGGGEYDYNKGFMINEARGRRYYLNNNVVIGTLYIEDWVVQEEDRTDSIAFEGGEQANRVSILHMPQGKWSGEMPYGVCGVAQELAKLQPEHKLIDTVTFESAADLNKNTTPDGSAYDFDSLYIEITLPAGTTFPACNIQFLDTSKNVIASPYYNAVEAGNSTRYAFIRVQNDKGLVWEDHGQFITHGGTQTVIRAAGTTYKAKAKIAKVISTQAMQPGTVVTIYGY